MGDEAEAKRWLESPARGLDYRIPVDVMLTESGRQQVYDLLLRSEYCVFHIEKIMPSENSKPEPEMPEKKKTMAELYPDLPSVPDTPDRPRYRPLADTVDHLRKCHESLSGFPDLIDIAPENLGQEMIEFNKKMDTDPIHKK